MADKKTQARPSESDGEPALERSFDLTTALTEAHATMLSADTKASTLLAAVGILLAVFIPITVLTGRPAQGTTATDVMIAISIALAGIAAVLLLLAIRPILSANKANIIYYATYADKISALEEQLRNRTAGRSDLTRLVEVSAIAMRKHRLTRTAVDILIATIFLMAATVIRASAGT